MLFFVFLFFEDKFDQFWAVNRKLMDAGGDENFKHIPFRCYQGDDSYIQKLVRPVTEEGQKKILQNLIEEVFQENSENSNVRLLLIILII